MIEIDVIVIWIFCGFLTYGLVVAHFQRTYPLTAATDARGDRFFAAFCAAWGPLGLFSCLMAGQFRKGWML